MNSITVVSEDSCPPGWYYNRNKCIKIFNDDNTVCTVDECQQQCQAEGAHLLEILDQEEDNFITHLALNARDLGMSSSPLIGNSNLSAVCINNFTL